MADRDYATFSVVCDECGSMWNSVSEWLEMDQCMPDRPGDRSRHERGLGSDW